MSDSRYTRQSRLREDAISSWYEARATNGAGAACLLRLLSAPRAESAFLEAAAFHARIPHVSILTFREKIEVDGAPAVVFAAADCFTLADQLQPGPLPAPEAMRVFRVLTGAVAAIHTQGGRLELTADRVFWNDGQPLIADLCALPQEELIQAPERLDQPADPRSDVYALGCLLHLLMSGRPAFTGSGAALLDAKRQQRFAHRAYSPSLLNVLERCLRADPASRYPHAGSLLAALEGVSVRATVLPPPEKTEKNPVLAPPPPGTPGASLPPPPTFTPAGRAPKPEPQAAPAPAPASAPPAFIPVSRAPKPEPQAAPAPAPAHVDGWSRSATPVPVEETAPESSLRWGVLLGGAGAAVTLAVFCAGAAGLWWWSAQPDGSDGADGTDITAARPDPPPDRPPATPDPDAPPSPIDQAPPPPAPSSPSTSVVRFVGAAPEAVTVTCAKHGRFEATVVNDVATVKDLPVGANCLMFIKGASVPVSVQAGRSYTCEIKGNISNCR